jgi:predicted homoserine dehydrogenase-like protein
VLSAALRGEPTGQARGFRADAVAVAKRDLAPGEVLDGEGGYTVWGKCVPARASVAAGSLPIGLAHGLRVLRAVPAGAVIARDDVEAPADGPATRLRAETEALLQA